MNAADLLGGPLTGRARPFTIGLSPLDPAAWIMSDTRLANDLAEKERLLAAQPEAVFRAEPESEAAQDEVLARLVHHLPRRFPAIYVDKGAHLALPALGRRIALDEGAPPLLTAARLVQEDLVLMIRHAGVWRMAAGAVFFPSAWLLAEKVGQAMDRIHAPVPGFGAGTRAAATIQRLFDHLAPDQPALRWNWGIHDSPTLHLPRRGEGAGDPAGPAATFLRVERQTLTRLPGTGAILFTIRTHLDPLAVLATMPDRKALATRLARQVAALTPAELAYKNLAGQRDALLAELAGLAA